MSDKIREPLKIKVRTNKNTYQYEATIEDYNDGRTICTQRKVYPYIGCAKTREMAILECLKNNGVICDQF